MIFYARIDPLLEIDVMYQLLITVCVQNGLVSMHCPFLNDYVKDYATCRKRIGNKLARQLFGKISPFSRTMLSWNETGKFVESVSKQVQK